MLINALTVLTALLGKISIINTDPQALPVRFTVSVLATFTDFNPLWNRSLWFILPYTSIKQSLTSPSG